MKDMIKTLAEAAKKDPKDLIVKIAVVLSIFVAFWAAMWVEAIMNGRA